MLAGVEIYCFAASYFVALALEVTRPFFRLAVRMPIVIGFAIAGLAAHVLYLSKQAIESQDTLPLSNWYHWCLIAALVLAMIYVYLAISRPSSSVGIFILPMVLGVIGLAYVFQNAAPFPRREAMFRIGMVHGITLLIGTITALLGFSAGLMYLAQDYRLKHKLPPRPGLKLPSLEWLQVINERALVTSGLFLLLGLASGALSNLYRTLEQPSVALSWNDPVVWFSAGLFLWLVAALLFNLLYRPAREGHKVVYLTLASCVMLALVLAVVLFSPSAHPPQGNAALKPLDPQGQGLCAPGSASAREGLTPLHVGPVLQPSSALAEPGAHKPAKIVGLQRAYQEGTADTAMAPERGAA